MTTGYSGSVHLPIPLNCHFFSAVVLERINGCANMHIKMNLTPDTGKEKPLRGRRATRSFQFENCYTSISYEAWYGLG